jgi:hypothetical protein
VQLLIHASSPPARSTLPYLSNSRNGSHFGWKIVKNANFEISVLKIHATIFWWMWKRAIFKHVELRKTEMRCANGDSHFLPPQQHALDQGSITLPSVIVATARQPQLNWSLGRDITLRRGAAPREEFTRGRCRKQLCRPVLLKRLGISRNRSSTWQKVKKFNEFLEFWKFEKILAFKFLRL